jgi:Ca2+-binding EF-hand superfamily protein
VLSLSEFDNLTKAIGLNWSSNNVNKLFRKFDKNNSDLIEFDEFLACMSTYFAYPNVNLLIREFKKYDSGILS